VTTGRVVVVVGALVVGVVEEPALPPDPVPEEDDEVDGVDVGVAVAPDELGDELAPGCSFATTMPSTAVAPVAASTAERVRRRRSVLARSRD
jgi:hypothetical protein